MFEESYFRDLVEAHLMVVVPTSRLQTNFPGEKDIPILSFMFFQLSITYIDTTCISLESKAQGERETIKASLKLYQEAINSECSL